MARALVISPGNAPAPWEAYGADWAEIDGQRAGYLVTRTLVPGESEVLYLEVAAEFRRQGVAESLLREAIARAPGEWFLEVRESNFAARMLYEKLGFVNVGRRENYYPDGPGKKPEAGIVFRFRTG